MEFISLLETNIWLLKYPNSNDPSVIEWCKDSPKLLSPKILIFLGLLAIIAVYFLASPSGTIISDDGSRYYSPIITELIVGDTSSVSYTNPTRGEFISENVSWLKEAALIIFAIFIFQYFSGYLFV